jgi:predicted transcriptional regulator
VWLYDGIVPINVQIVDERVLVWLGENRDETAGLLESENPAVLDWAESLYEEYRAQSEPLGELS